MFSFDYSITQEEQKIFAKISFDINQTNSEKKAGIDKSYNGIDVQGLDEEFLYCINAKYDLHDILMLNGRFGIAEYLNSNIPRDVGESSEIKGIDKYEHDKSIIRASVVEKGKNTKKLDFTLTGRFDSEEGLLMVTIYELDGKHRKPIYETVATSKSEPEFNRPGLFHFYNIEITTDEFENSMLSLVMLEFELKRIRINKKQKESSKVLGSETVKLKSIMELDENGQLQLNIMKKKKEIRGSLAISRSSLTPIFSFLDYKINLNLNVIPVVAIDYSLSNLTFDTKKQLIHTLKKDEDNDYLSVLNHILKVYQNLSPFVIGFGMGGKTLPKQQNASNIFALSGNIFNPIVEKEQLIEKYAEVFEKIKVSLPINHAPVMDMVTNYARYEKENYDARNFYSLIIITPGVIDDFEAALSVAKEVGDLPM